ncbi:hypothetical protein [Dyella solisilvae]|uniref:hypothetical protein n=1 Tax=Dyella solisilvae TaxID=1920168 RepID=UPI0011C069F8|nr:hypothetical protein [Dyella solisilvae]
MTDKTFYQAAAAEVAGGYVDLDLWAKVNAKDPNAAKIERQAKYIQLRAQEMAWASHRVAASLFRRRLMEVGAAVTGALLLYAACLVLTHLHNR